VTTFNIQCELEYDVTSPSHFLFHIEAARVADQLVTDESLTFTPLLDAQSFVDGDSGNRFRRLNVLAGPLSVRYLATVEMNYVLPSRDAAEVPVSLLPNELLHYLLPTRYCESDLLAKTALRTFGSLPMGLSRVEAVCAWIKDNIEYERGSSNTTTTARDVLVSRAGVCRDFAHLGVTFCRALNIPARLLVGYADFQDGEPPDFHAIFEAYLGGRWCRFDPTGLAPVERLVRVGTGRDAKDVAFATIYGAASMTRMQPVLLEKTA